MRLLLCIALIFAFGVHNAFSQVAENLMSRVTAKSAAESSVILGHVEVVSSTIKIYRTSTRHLAVVGANFPAANCAAADAIKIALVFEPELVEGLDYSVQVSNFNELDVALLDNRTWRTEPGPLLLTSVHLYSGSKVLLSFPMPSGGVPVAEVIADPPTIVGNSTLSAKPEPTYVLLPSDARVYQSALQQSITITGTHFDSDLSLVLDPSLVANVDYTLSVSSSSSAVLSLLPGKKWRDTAGLLVARTITKGDSLHTSSANGVCIATILADPEIFTVASAAKQSQFVHCKLTGAGFTSIDDINLTMSASSTGSLSVTSVLDAHTMFLELKLDLPGEEGSQQAKIFDLQLLSIDTGAGAVPIDCPVSVGFLLDDSSSVDSPSSSLDETGGTAELKDDDDALQEARAIKQALYNAWVPEFTAGIAASTGMSPARRALDYDDHEDEASAAATWATGRELYYCCAVMLCVTSLMLAYRRKSSEASALGADTPTHQDCAV